MLSLTTASTRPWLSRVIAWVKPSTGASFAPASREIWAQLLVMVAPTVLPLRSSSDLIESSFARVMTTPSPTE